MEGLSVIENSYQCVPLIIIHFPGFNSCHVTQDN